MFLQLNKIIKEYPRKDGKVFAVNDISLKIDKGDFITITGMSGSGKTTLLLIIGGLLYPTSGELIFNGQPVNLQDDSELTHFRNTHIGYVMQSFALIPYLTATENILLAFNNMSLNKKEKQTKAAELLNWVGLGNRQTHYPKELSAGQQQRVAIARALANNPSIILADEPTGNLDPSLATDILGLLKKINEEQKTTIIMVTHNMEAAGYGNKRIVIDEGKLVT